MEYAQLNTDLTDGLQVTTRGNVEWDSTHFCPASALTSEEADLFRVVPLTVTEPPAIDPLTQRVYRDGCEKVNGAWQYKWAVEALTAEQIEAQRIASVPRSVTRRQARQALLLRGKLALVQPAIDAIPDATQRGLMQIEWDDSLSFDRDRPSLIAIGAAIGYDALGLDDVFVFAATL